MATVAGFLKKIQSVDVLKASADSIMATKTEFIDQNNEQLYDGKKRDGNDIHPNYLEDPFFKTQAQALGYAKWKWKITPSRLRNFYTPNLFINGFYHSTREIIVEGDKIIFNSDASFSGSIEEKYGPLIDGLGGKYLRLYIKIDLFPEFNKTIKTHIFG